MNDLHLLEHRRLPALGRSQQQQLHLLQVLVAVFAGLPLLLGSLQHHGRQVLDAGVEATHDYPHDVWFDVLLGCRGLQVPAWSVFIEQLAASDLVVYPCFPVFGVILSRKYLLLCGRYP